MRKHVDHVPRGVAQVAERDAGRLHEDPRGVARRHAQQRDETRPRAQQRRARAAPAPREPPPHAPLLVALGEHRRERLGRVLLLAREPREARDDDRARREHARPHDTRVRREQRLRAQHETQRVPRRLQCRRLVTECTVPERMQRPPPHAGPLQPRCPCTSSSIARVHARSSSSSSSSSSGSSSAGGVACDVGGGRELDGRDEGCGARGRERRAREDEGGGDEERAEDCGAAGGEGERGAGVRERAREEDDGARDERETRRERRVAQQRERRVRGREVEALGERVERVRERVERARERPRLDRKSVG